MKSEDSLLLFFKVNPSHTLFAMIFCFPQDLKSHTQKSYFKTQLTLKAEQERLPACFELPFDFSYI